MRGNYAGCPASRSWIGTCITATAPSMPSTTTRVCSRSRSTRTTTTRRIPERSPTPDVVPALRAYQPELIIIASGLDASAMDPLASMMMTSDGYRKLTQLMLGVADEVCAGRLVMCHEGGYSPAYVPYCGLAIMEELAGMRTELADPLLDLLASFGGQELQPHQEAVIQEAMKLAAAVRAPAARHK